MKIALFLLALTATVQAQPFELKPNDVIALTGGSNIERTRFNGYLQTSLIASKPELKIKVRNFGWEGDTVFEQWRDVLAHTTDGRARLVEYSPQLQQGHGEKPHEHGEDAGGDESCDVSTRHDVLPGMTKAGHLPVTRFQSSAVIDR